VVILDVSAEVLTKLIPALTTPDLARIDGSFTDLSKTRELAAVRTGRGTASSPFRRGGDGGTPGTVDDPLASGYVLAEGAPPVPVPVPYSGSLHRFPDVVELTIHAIKDAAPRLGLPLMLKSKTLAALSL
jgi:hypothetical protein